MASQAGEQIITIHILPNISTSKGNQAMKFDQLIEYNVRGLCEVKTSVQYLSFIIF